jgi:hypothetical protein
MLECLQRHGWIDIDAEGIVHFTEPGELAQRAYNNAHETVLHRWQDQFGTEAFEMLRSALERATARLGSDLPEYPMPAAHRGAYPTGR